MSAAPDIDWSLKPAIQTDPAEHLCSVLERGDIEEKVHSSKIDVFDGGIKLDGRKNRPRLVEIIAVGPGRWHQGGRQPAEVSVGQIVYVKERTIPFRMHLRKQNHYFIPMDGVMAELDRVNVRLKPLGNYVMTREVEDRARVAIMGDLPFHVGKTFGVDKKGEEADDIGCNKTRIEEVVEVGPGEFGGFNPVVIDTEAEPAPAGVTLLGSGRFRTALLPWYKTPDVKPGDLIAFSDMARPCEVTLAGRKFTFFTLDFRVCTVLDQAV
jgi:co-chaperonin GroES (HSP10)